MALSYLFINYKNGAECLSQLAQFRDDIYTPAFPDENEREPFDENILPRLQTKGDILQTAIVLAYDGDQMVGGMLTDWYPSCSSLEIIYMAVAEDFRGKSLGHQILKEATAIVCESIEEDGVPVEYIFFETENPAVTKDAPIDTEARLRFFAAAGARLSLQNRTGRETCICVCFLSRRRRMTLLSAKRKPQAFLLLLSWISCMISIQGWDMRKRALTNWKRVQSA